MKTVFTHLMLTSQLVLGCVSVEGDRHIAIIMRRRVVRKGQTRRKEGIEISHGYWKSIRD